MMIDKLKRLLNDDVGVIALLAAIFVPVFIGFAGMAIDLGMFYSARAQLQNATDAAALAAANDLISDSGGGLAEANYYGSEATTETFTEANELLGDQLCWLETDLFEAGLWDSDTGDFAYTGFSNDPDDLTAVRITLTRNIDTIFIKIVNIDQVPITVRSTALLGCAGNGTTADLPIAVDMHALDIPGQDLIFGPAANDMQLAAFDAGPGDAIAIGQFINDPNLIPPLDIGDDIALNNGVIATLLNALLTQYNANKDADGEWPVILPVVDWSHPPPNSGTVVGFVYFVITEVDDSGGDMGFVGHWDGGTMIAPPGSTTGGDCYGVRASRSVLID